MAINANVNFGDQIKYLVNHNFKDDTDGLIAGKLSINAPESVGANSDAVKATTVALAAQFIMASPANIPGMKQRVTLDYYLPSGQGITKLAYYNGSWRYLSVKDAWTSEQFITDPAATVSRIYPESSVYATPSEIFYIRNWKIEIL